MRKNKEKEEVYLALGTDEGTMVLGVDVEFHGDEASALGLIIKRRRRRRVKK